MVYVTFLLFLDESQLCLFSSPFQTSKLKIEIERKKDQWRRFNVLLNSKLVESLIKTFILFKQDVLIPFTSYIYT